MNKKSRISELRSEIARLEAEIENEQKEVRLSGLVNNSENHVYIDANCPYCGYQLLKVVSNNAVSCTQPEAYVGERCGFVALPNDKNYIDPTGLEL